MHHALAVVYIAQGNIYAGDGLGRDEHSIILPKQLAGFYLQIPVLELILAQDHAIHALALEVDFQCGQGHAGNILEGQADSVLAADVSLE